MGLTSFIPKLVLLGPSSILNCKVDIVDNESAVEPIYQAGNGTKPKPLGLGPQNETSNARGSFDILTENMALVSHRAPSIRKLSVGSLLAIRFHI